MSTEVRKEPPARGSLVRDTRTGKVGVVMDVICSRVWLRKSGGGREWDVPCDRVEPVSLSDQLAERLRAERRMAGGRRVR